MKKLIIPTIMDTYGLIKFWDFDDGLPDGSINHSKTSKRGRPDFGLLPEDSMPSERGYKWRARLLQVPTPPHISLGLTCCPKLPHKLTQLTYQNVAGFFYYFIQISFMIISSHYDMKLLTKCRLESK